MAKDFKDKTQQAHGMGITHGAGNLFMSEEVGKAKRGDKGYHVAMAIGSRCPIITSEQTGKSFHFVWPELLAYAVDVGMIDADGPAASVPDAVQVFTDNDELREYVADRAIQAIEEDLEDMDGDGYSHYTDEDRTALRAKLAAVRRYYGR